MHRSCIDSHYWHKYSHLGARILCNKCILYVVFVIYVICVMLITYEKFCTFLKLIIVTLDFVYSVFNCTFYYVIFTAKVASKTLTCTIPSVSTVQAFSDYISNFLQQNECCINLVSSRLLQQICDKCTPTTSGKFLSTASGKFLIPQVSSYFPGDPLVPSTTPYPLG